MTDYLHAQTKGAPGAPLVVTFHGTGGDEHQFHDLARQLMPDAHVVSPRGDVSEHGMARFFRRTGEGVYDMEDLATRREAMAGFVRAKAAETGAAQVIALGYSNGANIAAAVALDHPDIFSDVIAMHPLIPWTPAPQPGLAGTRWLITAGERDPICPASQTQALMAYLTAQNVDLSTHWHAGGHELVQSELTEIQRFLG
ncbi:alpha/beta hydrolase [Marivita sp. S6314]|uniref:alpha/beta hydrolase n=1 Tax=Marivita sp. S6314 TaxID=2926406 RepID=UPI001FF51B84|nr:alpha/beta hydrolase [Marivita sp. S6314]MCK0151628.1 alpha/beta hydrolase [Marivita sp. S6314]